MVEYVEGVYSTCTMGCEDRKRRNAKVSEQERDGFQKDRNA